MRDTRTHGDAGRGAVTVAHLISRETRPRHDPPDPIRAVHAIGRSRFADAERHLRRALDTAPESAEVWALMGLLHERLGEHHAAYQCHKTALQIDRDDPTARDGLRRYCERFGFDLHNRAINPALGTPE